MRASSISLLFVSALATGCITFGADPGDGGSDPGNDDDGGFTVVQLDSGNPDPQQDGGNPNPQVDSGTPPAPGDVNITQFYAEAPSVGFLVDGVLHWSADNAVGCALSSSLGSVDFYQGVASSGSLTVPSGEPGESLIYTLSCEGQNGPDVANTTLTTTKIERYENVTITSAAGLAPITGTNVVHGNVTLRDFALSDLSALESLTVVDGDLTIRNLSGLTEVSLPYLERVGGSLTIDANADLTSLDLPDLDAVGDDVYVSRSFDLPESEMTDLVDQIEARDGIGRLTYLWYNRPDDIIVPGYVGTFRCVSQQALHAVILADGDATAIVLNPSTGFPEATYYGTYSLSGDEISLAVPAFFLQEDTTNAYYELDLLVAFSSPSLGNCWAIEGAPDTGLNGSPAYDCPAYDAGNGQVFTSRFEFNADGAVQLTRNITISGGNFVDTQLGIVRVEGARLDMLFGGSNDIPFLSASLGPGNMVLYDYDVTCPVDN